MKELTILIFILLIKSSVAFKMTRMFPGSHDVWKKSLTLGSRGAAVEDDGKTVEAAFLDQKNNLLLEKLMNPENGESQAEVATDLINFCDQGFSAFLDTKIADEDDSGKKTALGRVRYAVNSARQKKLMEADKMLRDILAAGNKGEDIMIKEIEAKLQVHLRKGQIDMAFMVILQLNIEDAMRANATTAVQIMTHMETLIQEYQDQQVSAPVRLMRMLVRAEDSVVRKAMLRQKLLIGANVAAAERAQAAGRMVEAQATTVDQCEHIVVDAVEKWGGAEVTVEELEATIEDVMIQMTEIEEEQPEFKEKCHILQREIKEVLQELE